MFLACMHAQVALVEAIGLKQPFDVLGWDLGAAVTLTIPALHGEGVVHNIISISGTAGNHALSTAFPPVLYHSHSHSLSLFALCL